MIGMFKKQSKSQRIGEKGEYIVCEWAVDNCLTPTKVENDFGID